MQKKTVMAILMSTCVLMLFVISTGCMGHGNKPPVADAGEDQEIWINQMPYAGIPPPGHGTTVVTFNGSGSHDPDGDIVNWTWDFGDGIIGYGEIFQHRYDNTGNYIVTLIVTDNQGAKDNDTVSVRVEAAV